LDFFRSAGPVKGKGTEQQHQKRKRPRRAREEEDEDEDEEEEEGGEKPKRIKFRPRNCAGRLAVQQSIAGRREVEELFSKQKRGKEEFDRKREENWIAHQALMKQVTADVVEEKKRKDREMDMREEGNRLLRAQLRETREMRDREINMREAEMELRREELAVRKEEAGNQRRLVEYLTGKKDHNE
jgi:hypothetical protein